MVCFSPPKGIQVFVTSHYWGGDLPRTKFQSPEGDSGLCYLNSKEQATKGVRFQSPEGDSGLCYFWSYGGIQQVFVVSVPRRGFRSLLLPGGMRINSREKVSVPRRGFRSLLLAEQGEDEHVVAGFSPPKGIQVFVTQRFKADP